MAAVAVKDRPSTRAQVRYVRMSASKARAVLDLIRGKSVTEADDVLALSERDAALVIQKCLRSAVANAEHNDGLDPDELFVSTCFADEGPTLRRFRPRARGRATRIRKRTCHVTVIVSRYDADELSARREREAARSAGGGRRRDTSSSRRRRVAKSRGEEVAEETVTDEEVEETPETLAEEAAGTAAEGAETVDEAIEAAEADEVTEDEVTEDEAADDAVTEDDAVADEVIEDESPEALVEGHTKDELLDIAEEAGVEVAKSATKAEIAAAIEAGTASAEELAGHHSKDELLELAEKAGVEAAKSWTKPQIAEAIVAARGDD
jgi:large subunit ribosomal protein L22